MSGDVGDPDPEQAPTDLDAIALSLKAAEWFLKAAEQGDKDASALL